MEEENSPLIKFGKKESVLMSWRTAMLLLSMAATGGVFMARGDLINIKYEMAQINGELKNQRKTFEAFKSEQGAFRLADAKELAEIRGKVFSLEGSVDTHRGRLMGIENDVRTFWGKLLELGGQMGQQRSAK